ncbi:MULTISPECIES: phasin family protein [Giesbergeria]|uniref:Phasin family protein n=1 Tax=Giesbergeria sinuosa TaxID=80883 RepID=A0ABV9QH51_9BURK
MPNTVRSLFTPAEPFAFVQHITRKACESLVQIATLNVQTAQSALSEQTQHWNKLLQVQRLEEFTALQASAVQPLTQQASHYGQELYQIANHLGQEWHQHSNNRLGDVQNHWAQAQNQISTVLKNMPVTAQVFSASMKNRLASANEAVSALQQVVTQAGDAAQANFLAAAQSSLPATA